MLSKLKWFHLYLILVIVGCAFYFLNYDLSYIKFGFVGLTIYYLWRYIYCRGIEKKDGSIEFNLSTTAEFILMAYFLIFIGGIAYLLYTGWPIWYQWIIPVIYALVFLAKAAEVRTNMNDKIILHNKVISWTDNGDHKYCNAIKCSMYLDETDSMTLTMSKGFGWFLEIVDDQNNNHKLDLKTLNLNGHKNALEKYLKMNGLITTNEK